jgi:hypothetical protein
VSDETQENPAEPRAGEPIPTDSSTEADAAVEPTAPAQNDDTAREVADDSTPAAGTSDSAVEGAGPVVIESEPEQAEPVSDVAPAEEPVVAASAPAQTVYVHAPVPPRRRGNRGIGTLIALGSAIIFAALYAVVVFAVVPVFAPPRAVGFEFLEFISSPAFFVPVLVFALGFILLVLVVNRGGWWAYILGSLVVGVFVYVVSIGILLLVNGIIGSTLNEGLRMLRSAVQSPVTIVAGIVAREVALWMGAAIAARGRRVKVRNAEASAAYDRDTARARADYERAVAANASR